MTAFADFIDLQTAVVELVKRPDIADVMPRLVALAEASFNRRLRTANQMELADVVISGGFGDIPYGFLALIGVYDSAGQEYVAQPPQALRTIQSRGVFAIVGQKIHAAADETLTVQFYAAIPTITGDARSSNWLLEGYPSLYLYAVAAEAAKYIGDAQLASGLMQIAEAEYTAVIADDHGRRYERARIRVPGVTP